ncbi:MAG: HAMP domain-containing histidine kinase [Deltaproteobacteria bacterium]|nr:HAMP domain-containing histidine kinase [Deltaproteobacteria bacterium]MBK8239909.1 HAMP domain-containing histidine kinase [Deltaproteobacteria bacterium]MBK8716108.1 HAMP domain-containing histidine kinase [Deltaproteobacteria bacterium]MBP7286819.1 HAMP domain-containing histidine kinase [Nannocystaceae bacterium]
MRIALKITLALTLWTIGVLLVTSERELDHEFELIDRDLADGLVLMGRALRPLVEDAWERGGEAQVEPVIEAAYADERAVQLRWYGPRSAGGRVPEDPELRRGLDRMLATDQEQVLRWPPGDEPDYIVAFLPIHHADGRLAAIELRRSLDVRRGFAERSRRGLWIATIVISSCAALMAIVLGWLLVGQRVGRMIGLLRAVGRGEKARPLPTKARDELTELTHAMNDMVDDLERARERGERESAERERLTQELRHTDRLATIGALMSRLAHELGTPLNVIAARTKLIAREQVSGTAVVDNARIAAEQTDRITAIVRSFLDFSRQSRESKRTFVSPAIVEHIETLLGGLARERHVELVVGHRTEAMVCGDLLLLQQAVTNLVVNALDVAPEGTRVTVDVNNVKVDPPAGRGRGLGEYVCVTVGDRGKGIDPQVLPHLFEPFFTTKPRGEGTGLGLSIASGISHEHGGWISVNSSDGQGTQFMLHLPIDGDARPSTDPGPGSR